MKISNIVLSCAVTLGLALNAYAGSGTISPSTTPTAQTKSDLDFAPSITITLSKNVGLAYNGSTTALAVNAGSTKGKNSYGGGTSGGSVKECTGKPVNTTNGYGVAPAAPTGDGCS